MTDIITKGFWLFDDEGKKDIAIVKHYLMKHLDKDKWKNIVRNYKGWDPKGLNACMFRTIIDLHYHYIRRGMNGDEEDVDAVRNPNETIRMRIHLNAIRDYWEEEVDDLQKELDKALDDENKILIEDHEEKMNDQRKTYQQQITDLEYDIVSLQKKLSYEQEKRMIQDSKNAHQMAHLNREYDKLCSKPDT
jgi:hypothetical protein